MPPIFFWLNADIVNNPYLFGSFMNKLSMSVHKSSSSWDNLKKEFNPEDLITQLDSKLNHSTVSDAAKQVNTITPQKAYSSVISTTHKTCNFVGSTNDYKTFDVPTPTDLNFVTKESLEGLQTLYEFL